MVDAGAMRSGVATGDAEMALEVVRGPRFSRVRYFCTTRVGGVSVGPHASFNLGWRAGDDAAAVAENRRRLRAVLPAEPLWLRQVHGVRVIDADAAVDRARTPSQAAPMLSDEPEADAAITRTSGRVLAVMTADCLPVLIVDAAGRALGVAHAGWRGLASGVLEQTVAALRRALPQASDWRAWIGPGIGPESFEVGADVVAAFAPDGDAARACFQPHPRHPGKWLADLPALAMLRLRRAGVAEVHRSGLCTVADPARFFSYRRDGQTGRMALLAWLEPAAPEAANGTPDYPH